MCGIAGIISTASISESIDAAATALRHRGPENSGKWTNAENVYLAHTRLSIIDLSEHAAQPMHFAGRYTIIHNGELYNYKEIKAGLQQQGCAFTTESDTEVIVAAYATYGAQCLQQFDGMFAFAIWDEHEKILFAARDRFGEKPFFFFYDEEKLVFASEVKALWALGVQKEVNRSMLYNFLTISYTVNPLNSTETFYHNINKLPAAHFLKFDVEKKELRLENYWQLEIGNLQISEADAVEKFQQLFKSSIQFRLRSDVPVGTSLSGGLDSSAVVAFCEQQHTSPQYTHKCFTIGFDGFEKNELAFAKTVVDHFGLQHFSTTLTVDEVPAMMGKVMYHQDEPFISASVLAQYKIYQLAKDNGVTVLLDGQGADEVLAGYHKYYNWYWQELYRSNKKLFGSEVRAAKDMGINEHFGWTQKMAAYVPDFAAGIWQRRREKKANKMADLQEGFAHYHRHDSNYTMPTEFTLNNALLFNTTVNGLEELLRLADRNSMAHAVEVRLPFLCHELVSYLFSLPPHHKIHHGWTKWLLRKSVEQQLPSSIVWRKDKTGLEPPQKQWMQDDKVVEAITEGKRKLVKEGILDKSVLQKKILATAAHDANNQDWKYWSASYLF